MSIGAKVSWLLSRLRIARYKERRAAEAQQDRRSREHVERLEAGIKDSPRGPGAMM